MIWPFRRRLPREVKLALAMLSVTKDFGLGALVRNETLGAAFPVLARARAAGCFSTDAARREAAT